MIAAGSFAFVFGLSEAATYGMFRPLQDFSVNGRVLWPATRPISIAPVAIVDRRVDPRGLLRVRAGQGATQRDPLFEFSQLEHLSFRYGLQTTMVLAMGQFGFLLVIPGAAPGRPALHRAAHRRVHGADGRAASRWVRRSARRFTRVIGTTRVVRIGLVFEAVGLVVVAR